MFVFCDVNTRTYINSENLGVSDPVSLLLACGWDSEGPPDGVVLRRFAMVPRAAWRWLFSP